MASGTPEKIKVVIADDENLFADGLCEVLINDERFDVIAKVNDGKKLIQTLNRLTPDMILLDIRMPYVDGLESAMIIKKEKPNIKIVLVSMIYDNHLKLFIKKYDINGFIIKKTGAPKFKEALLQIAEGTNVFMLPKEEFEQEDALPEDDNEFIKVHKLTKTEIEIIQLIADGDSTKIVAYKKHMSYLTAETHRKNILRKLKAKNMAQAIKFALKNNIIS